MATLSAALSGGRMASALRGNQLLRVRARVCSSESNRPFFSRQLIHRSLTSSSGKRAPATIDIVSHDEGFIPLVEEFDQQVSGGKLLFDALQQNAARKLTRLQIALNDYDHASFSDQLKQFEQYERDRQQQKAEENKPQNAEDNKAPPTISTQIPRGFYIHGNVGTGKSLLLNNFYNSAHTLTSSKKRRLHFHAFLQDIHQRIHEMNKTMLNKHGRSFHIDTSKKRNPILRVAEQLSKEVTLLCIDEFQVTDVADAMILSQFFGELWRRGVVVVATSNRPPKDLYEGGVNRGYFLPFVGLLERYCLIHHLGNDQQQHSDGSMSKERDYRRIRSGVDMPGSDQCGEYFSLIQEGSEEHTLRELDLLFQSFQKHPDLVDNDQQPLLLKVHFQRSISVSRYHSNIAARFGFDELCTTELGSSDYHAIANHFQIVMIENIPQLTLKHPDRARRFITLVDELYEAGCCLVCSAVDIPDRLFVGKSNDKKISTMNADCSDGIEPSGVMPAVDAAQVQGTAVSELASVKELSFAFSRAASRLVEMCSKTWWEEKGMAQP